MARVTVEPADRDLVEDHLWFLGATAIGDVAPGELEVGFESEPDAEFAVAALALRFPGVLAVAVDATAALEAALDAWKAHARPVRAGILHVRPPWLADDDDAPGAGERVVVVDPGRAFGSGSHPTTTACLEAVAAHARPGSSVLDVGCGSGVLAVAAAVLGAAPVVAIDTDPVAVAATHDNALANRADVDASTTPLAEVDGTYDLVLANIGAATLVALAGELVAKVAPGGVLVLSGLLATQADEVVAAFRELLEVGRSGGDWATVTLVSTKTQHSSTNQGSSAVHEGPSSNPRSTS